MPATSENLKKNFSKNELQFLGFDEDTINAIDHEHH